MERNNKLCDSNFIISNRAPAIALACFDLDPHEIVLVTPSDHLIKDEVEYEKVLVEAKRLAKENYLVTFGITPEFAETGFGYIERRTLPSYCFSKIRETEVGDESGINVKAFHEKPDFKTATKHLEAGNYYWNSGMFCFKAGIFLEEFKK